MIVVDREIFLFPIKNITQISLQCNISLIKQMFQNTFDNFIKIIVRNLLIMS